MRGPGGEVFEHLLAVGTVGSTLASHEGDDFVNGFSQKRGVGEGGVARVADDVDGACGLFGRAERDVVDCQVGVVGFGEHQIGVQRGEVGVDLRAQALRGFGCQGFAGFVEEGGGGFGDGKIREFVDTMRGVWLRDVVVQERTQPGVAGFWVGGEPDDFAHLA